MKPIRSRVAWRVLEREQGDLGLAAEIILDVLDYELAHAGAAGRVVPFDVAVGAGNHVGVADEDDTQLLAAREKGAQRIGVGRQDDERVEPGGDPGVDLIHLRLGRSARKALEDHVTELVGLLVGRVDEAVIEIGGAVWLGHPDALLSRGAGPSAGYGEHGGDRGAAFRESSTIKLRCHLSAPR